MRSGGNAGVERHVGGVQPSSTASIADVGRRPARRTAGPTRSPGPHAARRRRSRASRLARSSRSRVGEPPRCRPTDGEVPGVALGAQLGRSAPRTGDAAARRGVQRMALVRVVAASSSYRARPPLRAPIRGPAMARAMAVVPRRGAEFRRRRRPRGCRGPAPAASSGVVSGAMHLDDLVAAGRSVSMMQAAPRSARLLIVGGAPARSRDVEALHHPAALHAARRGTSGRRSAASRSASRALPARHARGNRRSSAQNFSSAARAGDEGVGVAAEGAVVLARASSVAARAGSGAAPSAGRSRRSTSTARRGRGRARRPRS